MIQSFENLVPVVHPDAYVHPMSTLIGQVHVGAFSSIWPGTVLRADMAPIFIGDNTSIQDGTIAHVTLNWSETIIGNRVTVGHRVILHGCKVEDECLIGMGSILLDNVVIGKGSLVAAGSVVTVGTQIPPNSLVMGTPAKVIRPIKDRELQMISEGWKIYTDYAKRFNAQAANS